jgi:hypothetical protein
LQALVEAALREVMLGKFRFDTFLMYQSLKTLA